MELKAKLHLKFDAKQITDRFRKREFVVEYADNPQYPQKILMQLTNDRCALLDNFNPGDEMEMHFDIRGREWQSPQGETKYFNSLEVWRINPAQESAGAATLGPGPQSAPTGSAPMPEMGDPGFGDDDLPF